MWKKDENKMQRVSGKKMTDQVGAYAMIAILADINGVVMIVYNWKRNLENTYKKRAISGLNRSFFQLFN